MLKIGRIYWIKVIANILSKYFSICLFITARNFIINNIEIILHYRMTDRQVTYILASLLQVNASYFLFVVINQKNRPLTNWLFEILFSPKNKQKESAYSLSLLWNYLSCSIICSCFMKLKSFKDFFIC